MNDPLSQLKDIHLPPAPGWWPPAPGWWLLLLLVALSVAGIVWLLRRRRRRLGVYRDALQVLEVIRRQYARHQDVQRLISDLSRLLRRVAISLHPGEDVAGMVGKQWLEWLDAQAGNTEFTRGAGRHLLDAAYRPDVDVENPQALIEVVDNWIRKVGREVSGV